jgi:AcrR family transcriptional regulator
MTQNAPPPVRPARLPSAERQAQILDAAVEEFAERGFAGARMATIATRAGVTKGLLYHYFPGGKLDLFRAAILGFVDPVLAEARALTQGPYGSRRELLQALITLGYGRPEMGRRDEVLLKLVLTEADRFPELAELYRSYIIHPALEMVRQILQEGIEAGDFRPGVAEEAGLAYVLLAPFMMGPIWGMMLGRDQAPSLPDMQAAQLELVLRGLAP